MNTITIIPLATPGTISGASIEAIKAADKLYVQTAKHFCAEIVSRLRSDAAGMDDLYDECSDFDELNERLADRLTSGGSCSYAVLNRGINSALMSKLRQYAIDRGFSFSIIPSQGYAEAALSACLNQGFDVDECEYSIRSAMSLSVNDTNNELIVEEIDSLLMAGDVKLKLLELYPDEHEVFLCTLNPCCGYIAENLPLCRLDFPENAPKFDAATVLVVPKCSLTQRTRHGMDGLMEVMHRLRAPGGCPWDAEQTHSSLRSSLIEESYEVLDAIDREDATALEEELGDLLLQVVFHAIIEEERREFNMIDVVSGIVNKLIYRHPHVFGEVKVNSADDVLVNWEALKKKEKHQDTVADTMRSVPAAFPALMRSGKIQKKAANVGFDFDNAAMALPKVHEEADEVLAAINSGDKENLAEEIGDLLFACVNVARLVKVDPELALSAATDKFMKRFISMEALILSEGKRLEGMSLTEMDSYWDRIKLSEKQDEI